MGDLPTEPPAVVGCARRVGLDGPARPGPGPAPDRWRGTVAIRRLGRGEELVMGYELRAEYRPAPGGREVHLWHVVHDGQQQALCGRELGLDAMVLPVADLPSLHRSRCEACRSAYVATFPPGD